METNPSVGEATKVAVFSPKLGGVNSSCSQVGIEIVRGGNKASHDGEIFNLQLKAKFPGRRATLLPLSFPDNRHATFRSM
jgi:hypothetical protein